MTRTTHSLPPVELDVSGEKDGDSHSELPPREGTPRRTSGARPGGRSERVVRDILEATAVELAASGYAKLGFDEVAARAGVAKTTIYRRWPTKAQLVTAALRDLHLGNRPEETDGGAPLADPGAAEPAFDTGSLRGDLLALLRAYAAMTATPIGMGVMRMLGAELDNPEVEAIARALRAEKRAPFLAAIERAIARGELAPGTEPMILVEVLLGTVVTRVGRLREQVDEPYLERLVDLVLRGAASDPAGR